MKPFPGDLHAAAIYAAQVYGDTEMEALLWQAENDLSMVVTKYKQNLLHLAVINGYATLIKILIMAGIDIESSDTYGNTPLILAAFSGKDAAVEALLDYPYDAIEAQQRVNIEAADKGEYTSLMLAAQYGFKDIVRQLLDHGANIHATNSSCKTALSLAKANEHEEIVALLQKEFAPKPILLHDKIKTFNLL
jgi:ankyrin repeat protein